MADRWEFWLERRAGVWVVVFRDGGCSPASTVEEWALRKLGRVKQEAAILAESENEPPCRHGKDCIECEQEREPPSLPLGHEFIAYRGYFVESDTCIYLGCGQPRSAHEPKP